MRPVEAPDPPRRRDGFRERGAQVTRLETFVDAAFAFAVTLLVISLDGIPRSGEALIDALKGIPAFAASFALLALIWRTHEVWSRRYGLASGRATLLSLALVFLVLVYVYPLKVLFATFFSWLTRGYLPATFQIASWDDIVLVFTVYGLAYATLGLVLAALYGEAWRHRAELGLDAGELAATRSERAGWLLHSGTGVASALIAQVLPTPTSAFAAAAPGLVFFSLFVTGPLGRWAGRRATVAPPR